MLDPISASSLAGSIVTFCDFSYKVGKRVYELSQLHGELPADIKKCKEIAGILERATERFSKQLPSPSGGQPTAGPSTLFEADLLQLFNQCTDITKSFLELLNEFVGAKSLSKVLKIVRKEGKLQKIHDDLDRLLLEIMYLLNGQSSTQTNEIKAIVTTIREEMLQHHAKLEAKMCDSITQLSNELGQSTEEVMSTIARLSTEYERALNNRQVDIVSGQQELSENVGRVFQNICDTIKARENSLATRMEEMLCEQSAATGMLRSRSVAQNSTGTMVQLARLDEILSKTLNEIQEVRSSFARSSGEHNHQRVEPTEQKGLVLKAEFEFSFRNEIIAIHVKQCAQFVSTKLFTKLELSWPSLTSPLSTPTWFLNRVKGTDQGSNNNSEHSVTMILKTIRDQHMMAQIKTVKRQFVVRDAVSQAFGQSRGPFWSWFSLTTISTVTYVKYERNRHGYIYQLADHLSSPSGDPFIRTCQFQVDPYSVEARNSYPADDKVSQEYAIMLKEEISEYRLLIVIGAIEITSLLLVYYYSTIATCSVITLFVCFTPHIMACNLLNVTDQTRSRLVHMWLTTSCVYQTLSYLTIDPPTFESAGSFLAFCGVSMLTSFFLFSSFSEERRSHSWRSDLNQDLLCSLGMIPSWHCALAFGDMIFFLSVSFVVVVCCARY